MSQKNIFSGRKIIGIPATFLALALIGSCGRYLIRESRASAMYENIQRGENEAIVVKQLGSPDQVLECGEYLWWGGDQDNLPKNDGRCKKWVRYNFFLHAFAFGYSSDGKLVSKYEYSSE